MLYKIFIDDSGKKEYITPYSRDFVENAPLFEDYEQFWRDNYFVLCGVRVAEKYLGEINHKINAIKKRCFSTHKVELKSDWLRNPHQREKHYIDPFGVTAEQLTACVDSIYELLYEYREQMKLLAVVFDKRWYGDRKRQTPDGHPLSKTAQIFLERIQYTNTYHIVVFDQMESSLQVHKGNNGKIFRVYQNKTEMERMYVSNFDKIADIKFIESKRENFLQIADLCAYNVYRQFVHYGREWCGENVDRDGKCRMNTYEYFEKIRCNFLYIPERDNKVCGVGLTCIPDTNKTQWDVLDGCNLEQQKNSSDS
ncbi:MAG: hypothetical protein COU30_00290 [Candidatus Magasanikbacteria bacterium CG10_big_fil_rev_8_21_14_0_10_38_6]|uniref:DUF3800 domain-containing protein n=1 Tax=Candidatus Magasanikbacteria bacterium CG10_big_fil_rev_8_21_14_0_10_38_6 TaxID=1974647 RepID=A0A2M6P2C2_9BACT|nr:MAG: hypothetical protein COU30_00290 [Candidatus Magasanikbacteria bacterium CG10_big_fil_rev_8_21_14_0_10_38_6]